MTALLQVSQLQCMEGYDKSDNNPIHIQLQIHPELQILYNEHLLPPHGKTACENIINAILGEAEYKDK